jgi:hypothetical protein
MIPYRAITDAADRRWTSRLLSRLLAPDLGVHERDDLVGALWSLSDARSFDPLVAILCDTGRPGPVRKAASCALRGMRHAAPDLQGATLRRWWDEGDSVLRKEALFFMDGIDCPDIVLRVASDGSHPFQEHALGRMNWYFDRPEQEAVKIAALCHRRPEVRTAAADVLLWDEPVAAGGPLADATRDPVAAVAEAAANTLTYYPSVRTLRALYDIFDHPDARVRERARNSFQSIRWDVLDALRSGDDRVASRLRAWLEPVWELLAFSDEEFRPGDVDNEDVENEGRKPPRNTVETTRPVADSLAILENPDASPLVQDEGLQGNGWVGYTPRERGRLRPVLLAHADQSVRESAARALLAWGDAAGLLELVQDDSFSVRKAAMFYLGKLPPDPGIADVAWSRLGRTGTHALETLATYVRHAPAEVAAMRLFDLAADAGASEGMRASAVDHLKRLKARHEVAGLAGLVTRPPAITWELHLAVFEATKELFLPSLSVGHLREVDNLHIQAAVAELDA